MQTRLSYYPTDLLVTGWVASLVYDTDEGAAPTIQLLEYANAQLLEFRHYDELLTRVLEGVYDQLEQKGGVILPLENGSPGRTFEFHAAGGDRDRRARR